MDYLVAVRIGQRRAVIDVNHARSVGEHINQRGHGSTAGRGHTVNEVTNSQGVRQAVEVTSRIDVSDSVSRLVSVNAGCIATAIAKTRS